MISSRFSRTAAMSEAAISRTELEFFASLLLWLSLFWVSVLRTLRLAPHLTLGPGGPL